MIRRNNYQISRDILVLARDGVLKTRIVYGANLNFKIVQPYLADLIAKGHLVHDGTLYFTTDLGREFILTVANVEAVDQGDESRLGAVINV